MGKGRTRADRRTALGGQVLRSGRVVMRPCSACAKAKRPCVLSAIADSCKECLSRGNRCDLFVSGRKWSSWEKSLEKLQSDLKEACQEADRQSAAASSSRRLAEDAHAREERLRKQIRFLEERGAEYVARDLSSIEELERLEQDESGTTPSSPNEAPQPVAENSSAQNPPAANLASDPLSTIHPLLVNWALADPDGTHPSNPVNWPQPDLAAPFDFAAVDRTFEGFAGGTAPVSSGSPSGT